MFVRNRQKQEIKLTTFGGYSFVIPQGVSWIWDPAGDHLLKNIYAPHVPNSQKDKYGFDNGHGVPPMVSATLEEWQADGKKLCQVERYKVNGKLVPRKKLISVAQERGVPQARVLEYLADEQIDAMTIAADINALPVPEDVRFPSQELMEADVPMPPKGSLGSAPPKVKSPTEAPPRSQSGKKLTGAAAAAAKKKAESLEVTV